MPASPGESLLTTVFADVHYFFGENRSPSKPQHHRFDKQSYVYLYHNSEDDETKIEVANHAGTPDQTSFFGYTDIITIQNSYLHPCLFSIVVNLREIRDRSTWHLETFNDKNEKKYTYPIHGLDIYLWTEKDAAVFLQHLKSNIPPEKLILKERGMSKKAHAEHRDSMSPVVQQLERTAIGGHFPPRTASTMSSASTHSIPPPPPLSAGPPTAYNPAAPSAPEPVTYREKTPPPPDDGSGTGLKAAAKYDNVPQHQPSFGPYAGGGSQQTPSFGPAAAQFSNAAQFSGPPQSSAYSASQPHNTSSSFSPPPLQFAGPPRQASTNSIPTAPSFGPMASSTISPPAAPQQQPSFGPNASQSNPGFSPPPSYYGPGTHPTASHQEGAPPPPPPVGGYSNYAYSSGANASGVQLDQHGAYTGDMHQQLYRPTEAEASSHGHGHGHPKVKRQDTSQSTSSAGGNAEKAKLEDGIQRLEGKVGKYLNKLDKLW